MTKWESRTEDLGFFPKNEVAFLAFLAFSLLKPMQNGFFLLGFLPKKPCSPYIKYSMAFLAFTWLFPRGKSQGKSRSYPYSLRTARVLLCTFLTWYASGTIPYTNLCHPLANIMVRVSRAHTIKLS